MSFDEIIWYDNTMLTTILVPDLKPRVHLVGRNLRQLYTSQLAVIYFFDDCRANHNHNTIKKCSYSNIILNNHKLVLALYKKQLDDFRFTY